MKTLRRVLHYSKAYSYLIVLSILFAGVTVFGTLYLPILTGNAVDLIVGKGQVDFAGIFTIIQKMIGIIAITAFAQWLQNVCNNKITYQVMRDVRNDAFEKLHRVPIKYVDAHAHGDLVSRVIADIDQFADGLLMGFTQLFTGVLTIVGTLFFMFSTSVNIALVVVVLTPLSLFVAKFIATHSYEMFRKQTASRGEQTAFLNEMVENIRVVKAFQGEDFVEQEFKKKNEELTNYSRKAIFLSSLTNPSTRFVNNLVYAGVGVFGSMLVIGGGMTAGMLTAFLSYANQYTKPFNEISGVVTELQNSIACAGRVFELIDAEEQPSEDGLVQNVTYDGTVEIKHIDFSYVPEQELIRDFNLSVKKGQRIAIVGPTGCGKTTFINLLMRFYDVQEGSIEISGIDAKTMTRKALRSGFGMVLQETWLQHGTVAENIAFGKPEATREEIIEAAKAAHAHGFIKRLPQGYDTVLGEEGGILSQGQRQLLCIARVMLLLPPMLILDEATSNIDIRTEQRIQQAFQKMMEGRTSFVVAHRLSTIQSADVILVMKDGKIIEKGNHKELLAQNGFYATLYKSQFAR